MSDVVYFVPGKHRHTWQTTGGQLAPLRAACLPAYLPAYLPTFLPTGLSVRPRSPGRLKNGGRRGGVGKTVTDAGRWTHPTIVERCALVTGATDSGDGC